MRVLADGRYAVKATLHEEGRDTPLTVDLVVSPAPRIDFPGATLVSGDFASGYAVPGLRASATGSLCVATACDRYTDAQAYHDHNWGGWRGVTWEWGATRAGDYTILYGRVSPEDSSASAATQGGAPLFVYVTDRDGFTALFRPRVIRYEDGRTIATPDGPLRVPSRAELYDVREGDTLRLTLTIDDATATSVSVIDAHAYAS